MTLIFGSLWGIVKFREHIKDKRFNTYHKLIDELVNEQIQPDRKIKLDRQIAIIYELRSFTNYFGVSARILDGLKKEWSNGNERVMVEIDLSLAYMRKNWLCRLIKNK
ncbi:MAG: hypothetical protein C3F02_00620 [Parcubacteria group bacterium]|nr:MAG: hypothetical protein C3F02_00620 [Parcubacteria group bacterium]